MKLKELAIECCRVHSPLMAHIACWESMTRLPARASMKSGSKKAHNDTHLASLGFVAQLDVDSMKRHAVGKSNHLTVRSVTPQRLQLLAVSNRKVMEVPHGRPRRCFA